MPEPFLQSVMQAEEGVLYASWLAPAFDTRAIFVAVAKDAEFTINRRIFIMPVVGEAKLRVGSGDWFVRVGAAQGTPEQGILEWSGIHGPITIVGNTTAPTSASAASASGPSLPVMHSKPVGGGYRIYTGKSDPHVVVFEMGLAADVGTRFPVGNTKWKWVAEKGFMGWTDCWGMNYPETYAIRLSTFEGPGFPTDRVVVLGPGHTFARVVCARTPFHKSLEDKQNAKGDAILLQQRKVDPNLKFSSHSEYLRFKAALVRSGHDNARAVGPTHFSEAEEGRL